jgi:replication factor C subunit 3/5
MSDYEDEMDVDRPSKGEIQFSSDNINVKGKKIVADLPVGAEDNLPWYGHHPLNVLQSFTLTKSLGLKNTALHRWTT